MLVLCFKYLLTLPKDWKNEIYSCNSIGIYFVIDDITEPGKHYLEISVKKFFFSHAKITFQEGNVEENYFKFDGKF